jgi:hypothetical protein
MRETWEIECYKFPSPTLTRLLAEGWEPFCAESLPGDQYVWVRRRNHVPDQ